MLKKSIIIVTILSISTILIILLYRQYYKGTTWNYEGQAVVLTDDYSYEFVGLTDVVLNGKVYGFGKYFLGDIQIALVENEHAHCQNERCHGMTTIYRHILDAQGYEYVNKSMNQIADQIIPATILGNEMPGSKMIRVDWYEWVQQKRAGGEDRTVRKGFVTGYMYLNKAGEMPFAFRLMFMGKDIQEEYEYCIIVPGVSTREEALSLLEKDFKQLLWMMSDEL